MNQSTLFRLREQSDLYADACIRDPESGALLFLSLYGRDGSLQHFLAALTLKASEGGFNEFTLLDEYERPSTVQVPNTDAYSKHTGKLPQNLFGSVGHLWLYDKRVIQPDRANGKAWVFVSAENAANDDEEVWDRIKDLSAVPLAEEWRSTVMQTATEAGGFITWLDDTGLYPPLGKVRACRLTLGMRFVELISDLVKSGALRAPGTAAESIGEDAATVVVTSLKTFELGQVVMTQGVEELDISLDQKLAWLHRHRNGDWGIVSDGDKRSNDAGLRSGQDRLMSAYPIDPCLPAVSGRNTVWIITEWDRSVTTLLLPSEY